MNTCPNCNAELIIDYVQTNGSLGAEPQPPEYDEVLLCPNCYWSEPEDDIDELELPF